MKLILILTIALLWGCSEDTRTVAQRCEDDTYSLKLSGGAVGEGVAMITTDVCVSYWLRKIAEKEDLK